MTSYRIRGLVNSKEWEAIFWASTLKVYKINAHPPFSIGLLHHDDIGEPLRIEDFIDKIDG